MGCYKPNSRNEKAKEKLQWANVSSLNTEQQKEFANQMFKILEDSRIPPNKALQRRPQMQLTDKETKILKAGMEKEEKRIKG